MYPSPLGDARYTKVWPPTRLTARTGTTGAGAVLQMTRALTSCWLRRICAVRGISALARMLCRPLSTCGERKLIVDLTRTLPEESRISTGRPRRTRGGPFGGRIDEPRGGGF